METKKTKRTPEEASQDALKYPGVAVNDADADKVSIKLEKERTCTLNNNPRNDEM